MNEISSDISIENRAVHLEEENKRLRKKIERLKKTMEITSKHGDVVTGKLEEKVKASKLEIEQRIRLISEIIPVPIVIAQVSDAKILYVNEHSCRVFGYTIEEIMQCKAFDLYENPDDRHIFVNLVTEKGRADNFEVRLKKKDGSKFWGALFTQPMMFQNQSCMVTVVYDLTERKRADEEIRRLNAELDKQKERKEKYLIFTLAGEEYGIHIKHIKEIIQTMPITPFPNAPEYIEGFINLRGAVAPVLNLRRRFGLEAMDETDQACIVIVETAGARESRFIGFKVDIVTEVAGIKGSHIEKPTPVAYGANMAFISGMAKLDEKIIILLDIDALWNDRGNWQNEKPVY